MSDDYTNTIETTGAVAVGGSATGEIESGGDKDWFAVELEAGRTYQFDLQGAPGGHGTLSDTFLRRILDAEGNKSIGDGQHRTYNDDFQGSRDSRVTFTATESGTYYVEASGDRDETGTYRLTVRDVTPEPEEQAPEEQEGQRQDASRTADVDLGDITSVDGPRWPGDSMDGGSRVFSFTLSEAKTVGLGLRQLDVDADLVLEDAEGNVIAESREAGTANEWISETLPAGTYFARVEAQAGGANDYRFRYGVTAPDEAEAARLEGVAAQQDTVADGAEQETEPERQTTRPPIGEVGPPSLSLFEQVFADAQVFPDSEEEEEPLVSQQQNFGDDYSQDIGTTGRVVVGGSVTSQIDPPPSGTRTDVDWFAVQLLAGRTYRIDLEGHSTGAGTLREPDIRGIYDAWGREIPGTSDNYHGGRDHNDQVVFVPGTDGTYYIAAASLTQFVVGSATESSAGTYRLSVTEVDTTAAEAELRRSAPTVEVGEVDDLATGYITTDRERAWFAVELEGGRGYLIEMEGLDLGLPGRALDKPVIFGVRDEHGTRVDYIEPFRSGNVAIADFEAPADGTYYILLGRSAGSDSGRYRLSVTKTDDYPDHTGTAGEVEVGGFATGEIETGDDVDWFAVELQTGVEYRIDLHGSSTFSGTLLGPELVGIYDSGGNLIENTANRSGGFGANALLLIDDSFIDTAGTYYIAVRGQDSNTGTYRVAVSVLGTGDDYTAGVDTTGTVEVGGFATGEIEAFLDTDWFAVELKAGTHYRIDVKGASSGAGTWDDPFINGVWDGEGMKVPGSDDDNGGEGTDSRLSNFEVEADGTYYIGVVDRFIGLGTYTVSVTETDLGAIARRNAEEVTVGGSATGDIERSGERDWFVVELEAGTEYRIDIKGANFGATDTTDGTLLDPKLLGIFRPDGVMIPGTENNDGGSDYGSSPSYNAQLYFEAEATGTYYIAATGHANYTGTYTVEVEEVM